MAGRESRYRKTYFKASFLYKLHCIPFTDVLYSVFIACGFCVLFLCCEFSLLSFVLCIFGTVIFLSEGSIKSSTANLQIPGRRKTCTERSKLECE